MEHCIVDVRPQSLEGLRRRLETVQFDPGKPTPDLLGGLAAVRPGIEDDASGVEGSASRLQQRSDVEPGVLPPRNVLASRQDPRGEPKSNPERGHLFSKRHVLVPGQRNRPRAVGRSSQAKISDTTRPATSVSRKSRPASR